jgi:hypothetical protein
MRRRSHMGSLGFMATDPGRRPRRRTSQGSSERGRNREAWKDRKIRPRPRQPRSTSSGARVDRPMTSFRQIEANRRNRGGHAAVAAQCPAPWADLGHAVRAITRTARFVSAQPCLICGRRPTDKHLFAEPRALGRRVSDEFAVPLCRSHHRALHRHGDEIA